MFIFTNSGRSRLAILHESLKVEQKEVSALFDLEAHELEFSSLMLLCATRALRCSIMLKHFGELFRLQDPEFSKNINLIIHVHGKFIEESENTSAKKFLQTQCHFLDFSEALENCLSCLSKSLSQKVSLDPQKNLMVRYLSNLLNGIRHLSEISQKSARNPLSNLKH